MKILKFVLDPSNRLDVVAGLIDGTLNALALASGRLIHVGGEGATLNLAFRVSAVAGVTTIFVFFVAHYAQLRLELVRYERQLNFTEHGKLAASKLGRKVLWESIEKAVLASGFSVIGAFFPLVLCTVLPTPAWLGLTVTIVALGGLGALLAQTIYGSSIVWGAGLFVGGIALALIGMKLELVG